MIAFVGAIVGKNGLLLAAAAGLIVFALSYDTSRVNHGRALERQKTDAASDKRTNTGNSAAGKSRTALPTDGGVRPLPELAD